jgi:adenine-specific DNA-methyltransferase
MLKKSSVKDDPAANVYLLLYPKPFLLQELKTRPELATFIRQYLNDLSSGMLKDQSRVYGDGLYKLEPRELANVPLRLDAFSLLDYNSPVWTVLSMSTKIDWANWKT